LILTGKHLLAYLLRPNLTKLKRTKPMQIKTTVKTGRVYNGNQEIVISLIDDVVTFTDQSRNINGLCQLDDIDIEMLQDETLFSTQANKAKYLENFIMAKYDAGQYKNA
jgi:ClpP class serine protease